MIFRPLATIVGSRDATHPSFMQAYRAGVLLSWVKDESELRQEMRAGRLSDLVIFDTRNQSEAQCRLCRALVANGYRVICIGCSPIECAPCHISEKDLLSAILAAVAEPTKL